jgi:hypothetical protein
LWSTIATLNNCPNKERCMHRLLLATFITAFALRADTFTFTSCTSGTTTISPCGGSYSSPAGLPDAMAGASASDNSLVPGALPDGQPPIPDGWTMSTGATAVAQGSDNLVVSATANASASDTFHSAGPVRSGFIQFNVTLLQLHGGNSTAVLTDGIHRYSYDALGGGSTPPFGHCFEGCQWASTVPFNLGVEFQVNTSSNDTQAAISFPGFVSHGNTSAVVTFRLLEADETTVVPFSVVLQVQILIKPGSAPPVPINAGSHGRIPVAILSTSTLMQWRMWTPTRLRLDTTEMNKASHAIRPVRM